MHWTTKALTRSEPVRKRGAKESRLGNRLPERRTQRVDRPGVRAATLAVKIAPKEFAP